jgi:hypothetical protein
MRAHAPPALNNGWERREIDTLLLAANRQEASMCKSSEIKRFLPRSVWTVAASALCILLLLTTNLLPTASAQETMRDRPMHRQHDGGGGGRGLGTGIGVGIGIGSMVIDRLQRQQAQDPRDVPPQSNVKKPRKKKDGSNTSVSKKKKKDEPSVAKKKKDEPKSSSKKKDEPGLTTTKKDEPDPSGKPPEEPVGQRKPPTLVTYPVPDFPIASKCNECNGYWEEVVRHKKIIDEKLKRLAEAEKELEDLKRERERLAGKSNSARGKIQKAYYQQMIKNADEHIDALSKHNDMMGDIIVEDDKTLAKWYDLYKECVDKRCPKQITQTPKTTTPQDTPQKDTPQVDTPQRETPTPVSAPPTGPCPDHYAELTNRNRVFHRLYISGQGSRVPGFNFVAESAFKNQMQKVKLTLEDPNRQAPGSTSQTLETPTPDAFAKEMKKLQKVVNPCEEVTIVIFAHGSLSRSMGQSYHDKDGILHINAAGPIRASAAIGPSGESLDGPDLDNLIKGFGPGVSVTVYMNTCWGGAFGGKGNVEQSDLVQVIGASDKLPGFDVPCRAELFEDFISGIDNAADGTPNGRATAREVNSHLARSGWPMGSPTELPR